MELGVNCPWENFKWEGIHLNSYPNLLPCWRPYFTFGDTAGELSGGYFQRSWNSLGDSYMGGVPWQKFSMGELSTGVILHGEIFCGENFPLRGFLEKHFPHRGISYDLKKYQKFKKNESFFQMKVC